MTTTNEDDIKKLEAQVDELTEQLEKAIEAAENSNKTELEALTKKTEELSAELEKAKKENADLLVKAAMTQDEKDHCSDMSSEDTSAFMSKPKDERQKAMKKRVDDDEVIKVEGQEIRKSVIGESQFNILKAQDARIKKQEEDIAKERDAREMAEFAKRADDEYPHVPGETAERAAMLKAISKMDDDLKKSFEAVFTQSEKLAKTAFDKVGNTGGDTLEKRKAKGPSDFEKRVDDFAKKGMTRTAALEKARKDFPDEFKKYQEAE